MKSRLAVALILAAASGPAQSRQVAPFTVAETGKGYDRLQDAVNSIGDGRGTILIAPGRYRDCAVQEKGRIAFTASERGTAVFDRAICEDKATLVLRGRAARVEGLVFTGTRVADGNGAGIRIEAGDLTVSYTRFADGQCGILSADDPSGTIAIDRSTFSGLGVNFDDGDAHAIYINHYGALTVTRSRFERGTGGHYLKSRAPRIAVLGSSFDDSRGRATNYMIDLPEGAVGRIAGNVFVQGAGKENYATMIAVAAEDGKNPSAGLVVEDNIASVAPGFGRRTAFVGDWSGEQLTIRANRLGRGIVPFARR